MKREEGVNVTCLKCGWVHRAVTRQYAEEEIKKFNNYFDRLSLDDRIMYYGNKQASLEDYDRCNHCSHKQFRLTKDGDAPVGVTIGPVIWENEE